MVWVELILKCVEGMGIKDVVVVVGFNERIVIKWWMRFVVGCIVVLYDFFCLKMSRKFLDEKVEEIIR